MDITYNGLSKDNAQGLITFTDIPNILKITDSGSRSYATISFEFSGNIRNMGQDDIASITVLGETITGVRNANNAINRQFYMSSSPNSTAASVARAFRNCPTVSALFTVGFGGGTEVELRSRKPGVLLANYSQIADTTIPGTYLDVDIIDGNGPNSDGSLITVTIAKYGNQMVTALEKSMVDGECAFNLSPVLTTIANIGSTVPYLMKIGSTKYGEYTTLGTIETNHIAQGFMCNQGAKYIPLGNSITIAQNYTRGNAKTTSNNTTLYVYGDTIPLSFYRNGSQSVPITITYRNSAFDTLPDGTDSVVFSDSDTTSKLKDTTIYLSQGLLNNAFYVDVSLDGKTIRYNVIKPVKAAEGYQRVYWRNSYGGISFFDFTGERSEARDVEIETYQKNIFNYYNSSMNELDMVYDNKVEYTVTLKSHLFEEDGKYLFNDILQSPLVWTVINGERYAIIIDSVSVEEVDKNGIYEAKLKYRYSQSPSLM